MGPRGGDGMDSLLGPKEQVEEMEETVMWALVVEMAWIVSLVLEEQVEETEGMVTSLQLLLFHHYSKFHTTTQDSLE